MCVFLISIVSNLSRPSRFVRLARRMKSPDFTYHVILIRWAAGAPLPESPPPPLHFRGDHRALCVPPLWHRVVPKSSRSRRAHRSRARAPPASPALPRRRAESLSALGLSPPSCTGRLCWHVSPFCKRRRRSSRAAECRLPSPPDAISPSCATRSPPLHADCFPRWWGPTPPPSFL
jgi:hypothetical protein